MAAFSIFAAVSIIAASMEVGQHLYGTGFQFTLEPAYCPDADILPYFVFTQKQSVVIYFYLPSAWGMFAEDGEEALIDLGRETHTSVFITSKYRYLK